jgi:hypothetical protein
MRAPLAALSLINPAGLRLAETQDRARGAMAMKSCSPSSLALFCDLYELTMAEACLAHAMAEPATDIAGAQRVDHREFAAEMRGLRRAPPSVVEVRDRALEVGEYRVAEIYEEAYDLGCKGRTVFRPNPVTGAVLRAPDREISVATPAHA